MKQDEMEIVKAVSARLDEETTMVVAYQYHTEKDPQDPDGKRRLKSASRYRVLARAEKTAEWKRYADALHEKAKTELAPWKWPGDPDWPGKILYSYGSTIKDEEKWIRNKLRKALPWETAQLVLKGYKKNLDLPRKDKGYGKYTVLNESAAFPTEGYTAPDGTKGSISDINFVKSHIGQTLFLDLPLKSLAAKEEPAAKAS